MSIARYLEPDERRRLLAELPKARDRLLVELGLNTGLRISSVLSLRWGQVLRDGEAVAVLEVPRRFLKGGRGPHRRAVSTRRVAVNESLRAAIGECRREEFGESPPPPDLWVFRSRKRFPGVIGRRHAHALLARAAGRAGLAPGIAPHGLRRSFAGDVYAASGHDLLAVQRLLGHASVVTTARYLKPEEERLDEIVRALPFRTEATAPWTGPARSCAGE